MQEVRASEERGHAKTRGAAGGDGIYPLERNIQKLVGKLTPEIEGQDI